MSEFCKKKGIKREFSVARTPQQNRVAKRKNRTLIEAARTMLADSKLPTTFWAEATAFYVQNRVLVVKPHIKTPYELFRGRTPALSFMRPFGCHVIILNTLDYLGKFDGKSDDGLFIRYSLNSVGPKWLFDIDVLIESMNYVTVVARTNSNDSAGVGPKWLFDIDVLIESMNYVTVVARTNSNDSAGTKESIGASPFSKEIGSCQDFILMPLWKDGSLFDSFSKNTSNDEPQPSNDTGKKDDDSEIDNQERPKKSAQDVNTAVPSINTASTNDNTGSLNINIGIPTVNTTPLKDIHADFFSDKTEVYMSNISTTYPVSSTKNIRIHKDHSLAQVIGDIQSSIQTRRMINEQGFISVVYEGKTHEDLYICLFACFLSQEEPKKIIQALNDPNWIEAMQEELLRFKLHQGYAQEEGIDYDEVFAPVVRIEAIRLFLAYASFKDFVVYQMNVKSAFLYGKIDEEVYVCQPPGFEDPEFPNKVYKLEKALYSLHQAPKSLYETLSTYLLDNRFQRGQIDKTLFIKKIKASTPMETSKPLLKHAEAEDVDVHLYRSMIGSLMYLTASRPDIMFAVCACARDSPFDLEAFSDSDYIGASLDRKSTIGGCQFLSKRLISWQCKKQTVVANLTTEVEYVAAANCYGQHIEIRHYFIRDSYEKKLIHVIKIHTDHNVADLLTKAFDVSRKAKRTTEISQSSRSIPFVTDKNVIKKWKDRMEKAATTASSLEAKQDSVNINRTQSMATLNESFPQGTDPGSGPRCQDTILGDAEAQTRFEDASKQSNDLPLLRVNTLGSGEDIMKLKELMEFCTKLFERDLDL
ncbi:putative ribonuclease H-like domain-containing protein [Tanacetum coccineum]